MATNTDLIRELNKQVAVFENEVERFRHGIRQLELDRFEFAKLHGEHQKESALLKQGLEELQRRFDESDRRIWWLFTAVLGACLTAIVGLIVALLKK